MPTRASSRRRRSRARRALPTSITRKATGEYYAQLRAERDNPKADVWYGGTIDPFLQGAAEGLFAPYRSPRLAELAPWAQPAGRARPATGSSRSTGSSSASAPIRRCSRSAGVAAPRCWSDLVKPRVPQGDRALQSGDERHRLHDPRHAGRAVRRGRARSTYLKRLAPNVDPLHAIRHGAGTVGGARRSRRRRHASCTNSSRSSSRAFAVDIAIPVRRHRRRAGRHGDHRRRARIPTEARAFYDWALTQERAGARQPHAQPASCRRTRRRTIRPGGRALRECARRSTSIRRSSARRPRRKRLLARWQREIGDALVRLIRVNEFELIARYFTRPPRSASVALGVGDDAALLAPDAGLRARGRRSTCWSRAGISSPTPIPRRSATRRSRSTCPTWRRWARRRAGRCSPARCPTTIRVARGVRARLLRARRRARRRSRRRRHDARAAQPVRDDPRRSAGGRGDHARRRARRRRRLGVGHARRRGARARGARRAHDARRRRAAQRAARGSSGRSRASRSAIALRGVATAALDVSDGLTGDLGHILERRASAPSSSSRAMPRSPRARREARRRRARARARNACSPAATTTSCCFTAPPAAARADRGDRARAGAAADAHRRDRREARARRARRAGRAAADAAARFDHFAPARRDDSRSRRCGSWSAIPRISSRWASAPGWRRSRPAPSARWSRSRSRAALRAYAGDAGFVAAIVVLFARRRLGVGGHRARPRRARPRRDRLGRGGRVPARAVLRRRRRRCAIAFAFLLFRFFDIVKPPPIRQLDAALKNGFGVMLDDIARRRLHAARVRAVAAAWPDDARRAHRRAADRCAADRGGGLNALQTQRQLFYDGWLLRCRRARRSARAASTRISARRCRSPRRSRTASASTRSTDCRRCSGSRRSIAPGGSRGGARARAATSRSTDAGAGARARRAPEIPDARPTASRSTTPDVDAFVDAVGELRGSPPQQRDAHRERLVNSPLDKRMRRRPRRRTRSSARRRSPSRASSPASTTWSPPRTRAATATRRSPARRCWRGRGSTARAPRTCRSARTTRRRSRSTASSGSRRCTPTTTAARRESECR